MKFKETESKVSIYQIILLLLFSISDPTVSVYHYRYISYSVMMPINQVQHFCIRIEIEKWKTHLLKVRGQMSTSLVVWVCALADSTAQRFQDMR